MEEKMTKKPAQSKRRGLLRKAFWTVAGVVGAGSLFTAKATPAYASVLYVTRATGYFTITRTLTDKPSDHLPIAYLIVN